MKRIDYPAKAEWATLLQRPVLEMEQLFDTVRAVIADVRSNGDKAVIAMEEKFDKVSLSSLAVTEDEIVEAESLVDDDLKEESERILHQLGLTTTEAIRLFLTQVRLRHGLPFRVELRTQTEDNEDILLPTPMRQAALDSVYDD